MTVEPTIDVTATADDSKTGEPLLGVVPELTVNSVTSGVIAVDNGDGSYTFVGVPLGDGDNQLQVLVDTGTQGASPIRTVTYKTSQPTITLTDPTDGQVINMATAACAGQAADCLMNVSATVTNAENGSLAEVSVNCGPVVDYQATVSDGTVTFTNVVLAHGGGCTLTPSVTDQAQQSVTGDGVTVTVDRVQPLLVRFDDPLQEFLGSINDLDPGSPGIQYKLEVVLQGVEAGQILTVEIRTQEQAPGTGTIFQEVLDEDVPEGIDAELYFGVVDYPDGVVVLEASVTDLAGNAASLEKVLNVQSTEPVVKIKQPS